MNDFQYAHLCVVILSVAAVYLLLVTLNALKLISRKVHLNLFLVSVLVSVLLALAFLDFTQESELLLREKANTYLGVKR